MSAQQKMNDVLLEWDGTTRTYRREVEEAGRAKAEYERDRARFIVKARAGNDRMSQAQAETEAAADDDVYASRLAMLAAEAKAESTRQRLYLMRAKSDALRTERVDERESNRLYADHPAGA